ncbi:MAG: DUF2975 domain-containing protein [Lachnospiraceae bacterium]|nr:DUF2975 domain-containing protein [Lachnospiraceae bacterium]
MNINTKSFTKDTFKINPQHCNLLIAFTVIIMVLISVSIANEVIYILNAVRVSPERFYTENISGYEISITAPIEGGKNISRIFPNDKILQYHEMNSSLLKRLGIVHSIVTVLFFYIPVIGIAANIMSIIKNMKEQYPPFLKDNAKKIAQIGGNIILLGFANTLALFAIIIFAYNDVWIGLRFRDKDVILIAVGLLMIILSRIFSYGSYLQEEYDETI